MRTPTEAGRKRRLRRDPNFSGAGDRAATTAGPRAINPPEKNPYSIQKITTVDRVFTAIQTNPRRAAIDVKIIAEFKGPILSAI